jgi:hypothetical protein
MKRQRKKAGAPGHRVRSKDNIDAARPVASSGPLWTAEIDPEAAPIDPVAVDRAFVDWLMSIDEKELK